MMAAPLRHIISRAKTRFTDAEWRALLYEALALIESSRAKRGSSSQE